MWQGIGAAMKRAAEQTLTMRADSDPRVSQSAAIMTPAEKPTTPEGFIPWHGGECPVAGGTVVDCAMRGRYVVHKNTAKSLRWYHVNDGDTRTITDIIAYRIHKPADFRLEAGKFYVTASGERVGPMRHKPGPCCGSYTDSDDWGRWWWWPNGKINFPGSCNTDILALSFNQESSHDPQP
jgi:hypothetical protein